MRVGRPFQFFRFFILILSLVLGRAKQLFRPPAPPMPSMSNFERARELTSRARRRAVSTRAHILPTRCATLLTVTKYGGLCGRTLLLHAKDMSTLSSLRRSPAPHRLRNRRKLPRQRARSPWMGQNSGLMHPLRS